jgi:hypothetical protein
MQSSIAVLGLTYSASPGIADIYREPGINSMAVPNMTHFAHSVGRFSDDNTVTESYAAHVLGDNGSSYNVSALPEEPLVGKPWASYPAGFWSATDHWEYRFLESAPSLLASGAQAQFLAIYSDRVAKSNATCKVPPFQIANNGRLANVRLLEDNRTFIFLTIAEGVESVYYLTAPILANGDSNWGCGPGCNNVKVLELAAGPLVDGSFVNGSSTAFFFYDCNVIITAPSPDVPPIRAAQAAQAIALSGQIHSEFQNISDLGNSSMNQFAAYNFGTPFGEPQNNSAKGMASLVSRFAIGVISAAAQTNAPMIVLGSLPAQGLQVQLDSFLMFNLILVITGALQLALVLATAAIVSRLTIPQEILLSHHETIQKRFVLSS